MLAHVYARFDYRDCDPNGCVVIDRWTRNVDYQASRAAVNAARVRRASLLREEEEAVRAQAARDSVLRANPGMCDTVPEWANFRCRYALP
jgi:hypothetical protein